MVVRVLTTVLKGKIIYSFHFISYPQEEEEEEINKPLRLNYNKIGEKIGTKNQYSM